MHLNERRDVGAVACGGGDQAILSELNCTIDFVSVVKEFINSTGVGVILEPSLEKLELLFGQKSAVKGKHVFLRPSTALGKK